MSQTYPYLKIGSTSNGLLVLTKGRFFRGKLRGAHIEANGEVFFNTSMTGYQEILTDPSYSHQIVTLTYPPATPVPHIIYLSPHRICIPIILFLLLV